MEQMVGSLSCAESSRSNSAIPSLRNSFPQTSNSLTKLSELLFDSLATRPVVI